MRLTFWLLAVCVVAASLHAEPVKLLKQEHDPYGFPRPGAGHKNVPLRTSFFFELGFAKPDSPDRVLADSVALTLQPDGGEAFDVLKAGSRFAAGYSGRLFPATVGFKGQPTLAVYITSETPLKPSTTYAIRISARSRDGGELPASDGTWRFTTEASATTQPASISLDFRSPAVKWHGAFFSGFCKVNFCASDPALIGTYELMAEARRRFPRAWSLQRDFWLTGLERGKPGFLPNHLPNIVRELETRRIAAMDKQPDGILLKVEDFFGHEQYGIPAGRPLSGDYHPGDEVLIADGAHDARTKVLAIHDDARTILASAFDTPKDGWHLDYAGPLPTTENPHAPGLFPPGGCYLIKFRPAGTPRYYWGRVDKEWDIAHRRFGRRLMVNFTDAPGDLAIDGRNWTTTKDYVELHEVVRTITDHVIERYGDASLDFVWSIFNEPDLGGLFWRTSWDELQKFYDYSTDAILRAFEDRGYDSNKVFIGGLELGGVFGVNLKLGEFLAHCSPRQEKGVGSLLPRSGPEGASHKRLPTPFSSSRERPNRTVFPHSGPEGASHKKLPTPFPSSQPKTQTKGALPSNAAFADARLNGKRSKRVEALCRASDGRGAPCDFISVHAYNRSELMAAKLIRAKDAALEIDPEYYAKLWVNSHEACPNWMPPPDPAAADSYLGNGYYPTWCADVARRQLQAATGDARYAFGETILTFWPWPTENFAGHTTCTRSINTDDDGDARPDRKVLVPTPVFHFLGLLNSMSDEYRVFPEQLCGGHIVSGFASRSDGDLRVLLYTHNTLDTQSRSDREFAVSLDLSGVPWPNVRVEEYRFDRNHNTYYEVARQLRDTPPAVAATAPADIDKMTQALTSGDKESVLAALKKLAALGPAAQPAASTVFRLAGQTTDDSIRSAAFAALQAIGSNAVCYSARNVTRIQALAELHATNSSTRQTGPDGRLRLSANLAGNGVNFLIIRPATGDAPGP